jgi:HNH endonuclease/CENP-B N-terminal DNA-binding domain
MWKTEMGRYSRLKSNSLQIPENFWNAVKKTDGCWLWLRGRCNTYGWLFVGQQGMYAHRYSWILTYGKISDDKWVLHKCDTPLCVRPDHLFIGNVADNVKDMISKGRGAKGERRAIKLTNKKILEIRRLCETKSQPEVAKLFNINQSTVSRIVCKKRWAHI